MQTRVAPWVTIALLFAPAALRAQTSDQGQTCDYSILNPEPDSMLGKMHTDRPTKSATPFTVAPGHVQLEMGALTYTHDDHQYNAENLLTFGIDNVRIGLLCNLEAEFITVPARWRITPYPGYGTDAGFGNETVRVKYMLWGKKGTSEARTALALMPILVLPTGMDGFDTGGVQGGIGIPFTANLPKQFTLNTTAYITGTAVSAGSGRNLRLADAVAISHSVANNLEAFAEYYYEAKPTKPSVPVSTLDLGLKYQPASNWQINLGVFAGLTDNSPGLHLIFGFAKRF